MKYTTRFRLHSQATLLIEGHATTHKPESEVTSKVDGAFTLNGGLFQGHLGHSPDLQRTNLLEATMRRLQINFPKEEIGRSFQA